jgi:uncharacterized protein
MMAHWFIYLIGGLLSGGINAMTGGGTLLLFPMLIGVGYSPLIANTTMSIIVQPGTYSAVYGYRAYLKKIPWGYYLLLIPTFIGALLGAIILNKTPHLAFEQLAPVFMVFATLLLIFQQRIQKALYKGRSFKRHHIAIFAFVAIAFLFVSMYGGYFGAGAGILALGLLGLTRIKDLHQMNGLRNVVGLTMGLADCTYFIVHGLVGWKVVPLFAIGNLVGGYYGSIYGVKLNTRTLRIIIVTVSSILTVYLFYKFH